VGVWNDTLGHRRDVVRSRPSGEERILQARHEFVVIGILVIGERLWVHQTFNIQIKPVDRSIPERARLSGVHPCRSARSKGAPEEVGKVLCDSLGWKGVVGGPSTSNGEKNLLAIGLAPLDTRINTRTVGQEATLLSVRLGICSILATIRWTASAVVLYSIRKNALTKVSCRIVSYFLRELVDEGESNNIDTGIITEIS